MNAAIHPATRRQTVSAPTAVAVVALLAMLVAVLAGRPHGRAAEMTSTSSASASGGPASIPVPGNRDGAVVPVELVVGDKIASGTLSDTPEAREFAAKLPVTLAMDDRFGLAKAGQLPHELDVDHAARSRSYTVGDLSYWSPSARSRSSTTPGASRSLRRDWFASAPWTPASQRLPPQATTSR